MKVFILFLFLFLCYTNVSAGKVVQYCATIFFKALKCPSSTRNLNLDVSKINVYFYDFRNGVTTSVFPIDTAVEGISLKIHSNQHHRNHRNEAKQFFMYVGGFKSHIKGKTTAPMIKAFKEIPNSYLIIVDHSAYTHSQDGMKKSYERSVKYVPSIGKKLSEMLAGLKEHGVLPKNIHCIGHSLGGQILEYVGENYKKIIGQTISRMTALDPAGPCFENESDHVRSGIADYVEIYHCNGDMFGSKQLLGDIDIFVNNGKSQPECGDPSLASPCAVLLSNICSHKSCVMVWTASVLHKNWYPAYECPKHKDFENGMCYKNQKTTAGFWNPRTAKGKYYFSTDGYNYHF